MCEWKERLRSGSRLFVFTKYKKRLIGGVREGDLVTRQKWGTGRRRAQGFNPGEMYGVPRKQNPKAHCKTGGLSGKMGEHIKSWRGAGGASVLGFFRVMSSSGFGGKERSTFRAYNESKRSD